MSSKYRGHHQLQTQWDALPSITNVIVPLGMETVEIASNGAITTRSAERGRLDYLKVLALVAARSATDWTQLSLGSESEYEDDKLFKRAETKISLLEFLGENVIAAVTIERLRILFRLRNLLAHGNWKHEHIGDELNNLLQGGRMKWLTNGRLSHEASGKVLFQIIEALGDLRRCRDSAEMDQFKKLEGKP